MKRTDPITNETEFQEWLASAFESERQRLREAAKAGEFLKPASFEAVVEKYNEGDTAS